MRYFFKTAQNQISFAKTKLSGCFFTGPIFGGKNFRSFYLFCFFKSATNSDFEGFREH